MRGGKTTVGTLPRVLVAAINWTPIIAAGVGGATAILAGLVSAWVSARTTRAQLQMESARAREEREHADKGIRRGIYARLLNEERNVWKQLSGGPNAPKEEVEAWLTPLFEPLNEVILTGTTEVASAAVKLYSVVIDVGDVTLRFHANKATMGEWEQLAERDWPKAVTELLDAMRVETSADGRPVDWSVTGNRKLNDAEQDSAGPPAQPAK